jgi:hypothetical protein
MQSASGAGGTRGADVPVLLDELVEHRLHSPKHLGPDFADGMYAIIGGC